MTIRERGPWSVGMSAGRTYLESADFTHDVRLYIDGDFETHKQRLAYANEIARKLNAHTDGKERTTPNEKTSVK